MNNKSGLLAVSAILGAVMGVAAGMLLLRRAEQRGTDIAVSGSEGLSIGLLVIGLLRQISTLGEE
ncbi:MAG: hypothetical protein KIT08_04275 [Anaerolineales bacterium]|nr:MAG: hypothetical protein KIT08_04275 [Anaerolineales bacterium]